jgi:hypothetical protein
MAKEGVPAPEVAVMNVDGFMPESWNASLGERAFQYDAFISHNQNDRHSTGLVHHLLRRDVQVWHDRNSDLRDKRIQAKISGALRRSRFVVVCVGRDFHDSPWCRAEYLPALDVERRAGAVRVLVAQMSPRVSIPPALDAVRRYQCHEGSDLERLTDELRAGNKVAIPHSLMQTTQLPTATEVSRARDALHGQADFPAGATEPLELMADVLALCSSTDSGHRADGLTMLLHLCDDEPRGALATAALRLIANEKDESIIHLAFPWFEQHWGQFDDDQRQLVEISTLRAPLHMRSKEYGRMIREFSAATRVKVFVRGLELERLSAPERFHLVEQEIMYILALYPPPRRRRRSHTDSRPNRWRRRLSSASPSLDPPSPPGRVRGLESTDMLLHVMGISNFELALRELDGILFDRSGTPRVGAEEFAARYVRIVARTARVAARNNGHPLSAMRKWILDFVLIPLLWCSTVANVGESASRTYLAVCDSMKHDADMSEEVHRYREALTSFTEFRTKFDVRIF